MSREAVSQLYLRWLKDVWSADAETIRKSLGEIVTPDFVGHWPEHRVNGARELADWVSTGVSFFDDLSATVTQGPLIDGNLVAARWLLSGKYAGGLPSVSAPVGTLIEVHHVDILRVRDDKFAELWASSDQVEGLKQIGANSYTGCQWFQSGAALGI